MQILRCLCLVPRLTVLLLVIATAVLSSGKVNNNYYERKIINWFHWLGASRSWSSLTFHVWKWRPLWCPMVDLPLRTSQKRLDGLILLQGKWWTWVLSELGVWKCFISRFVWASGWYAVSLGALCSLCSLSSHYSECGHHQLIICDVLWHSFTGFLHSLRNYGLKITFWDMRLNWGRSDDLQADLFIKPRLFVSDELE